MAPTVQASTQRKHATALPKKGAPSTIKKSGKRHHVPSENLGGLKRGALVNISRRAGVRETKEGVVLVAGKIGRAFVARLARNVLLGIHARGEGRTVMPRDVDFALARMKLVSL